MRGVEVRRNDQVVVPVGEDTLPMCCHRVFLCFYIVGLFFFFGRFFYLELMCTCVCVPVSAEKASKKARPN